MKRLRRTLLPAALLLFLNTGAQSAPLPPRPYSGCGVLTLSREQGIPPETLALYQEPGLNRIAERSFGALPRLAGDADQPVVAASERRGSWTRLFIDEAGRQGWLAEEREWEYASWDDFLPGRVVRVLPGLRKGWYALRGAPDEAGDLLATLSRDQRVKVVEVEEDWARLESPSGWFRWRDGDGRLTVSLQTRQ